MIRVRHHGKDHVKKHLERSCSLYVPGSAVNRAGKCCVLALGVPGSAVARAGKCCGKGGFPTARCGKAMYREVRFP